MISLPESVSIYVHLGHDHSVSFHEATDGGYVWMRLNKFVAMCLSNVQEADQLITALNEAKRLMEEARAALALAKGGEKHDA